MHPAHEYGSLPENHCIVLLLSMCFGLPDSPSVAEQSPATTSGSPSFLSRTTPAICSLVSLVQDHCLPYGVSQKRLGC